MKVLLLYCIEIVWYVPAVWANPIYPYHVNPQTHYTIPPLKGREKGGVLRVLLTANSCHNNWRNSCKTHPLQVAVYVAGVYIPYRWKIEKKIFYCWVKPIHYSEFYTRHPCTTLGLQITQNIGSHDASATSLHSTTSLQQVYPPKNGRSKLHTVWQVTPHHTSHLTPHSDTDWGSQGWHGWQLLI